MAIIIDSGTFSFQSMVITLFNHWLEIFFGKISLLVANFLAMLQNGLTSERPEKAIGNGFRSNWEVWHEYCFKFLFGSYIAFKGVFLYVNRCAEGN